MLSEKEILRYSRHIRLSEVGYEGQAKLKSASVLVIGAGGLGCPVLQYLVAAGVGKIGVIDNDVVDISNLQRQVLFSEEDIDKPKPIVAVEKLKKQNTEIEFKAYFERLTTKNIFKVIEKYNIVVDCSDNFPTRYLINDACVISNKILVYGAIDKFDGQVTVFNYNYGPTLRCLSPEQPSSLESPSCAEVGVIGVIPGIIGAFQANEVIKIILGIGDILSGKLLLFDALNYSTNIISFSKQNSSVVKELGNYNDFCLSEEENVKKISQAEFQKLVQDKDILIIDVRYPDEAMEFDFKSLKIPIYEIENKLNLIPKDKKVIFVCDYEIKSIMAANFLMNKYGYTTVYSLENGLTNLKKK